MHLGLKRVNIRKKKTKPKPKPESSTRYSQARGSASMKIKNNNTVVRWLPCFWPVTSLAGTAAQPSCQFQFVGALNVEDWYTFVS